MDYRHYREDLPPPPKWLEPHLHKLHYIGTVMIISVPVIGWLTVLHIIKITFFLYVLACLNTTFGMLFVAIGLSFDTQIDRERSEDQSRSRSGKSPNREN